MLELRDLRLRRGATVLFDRANLTIFRGDKIGIVGRNGCGKSSLLALLRGDLGPDAGDYARPGKLNFVSVSQELPRTEATVLDEGLQRWLQAVETVTGQEVISPSNTVHIEHFLIGWVMQHSVPAAENVKVWLEGNVSGDGLSGVLPLTTTFDYNSCGRGLYSSYHTLGRGLLDFGPRCRRHRAQSFLGSGASSTPCVRSAR